MNLIHDFIINLKNKFPFL